MPVFPDFLDVVLQVVEEQLHHVQFLLSPPDTAISRSQSELQLERDVQTYLHGTKTKKYTHMVIQWVS